MAKTQTKCARCGGVFLAENKELNRGKARFCGVSCANSQRSSNKKDPEARAKWLLEKKGSERFSLQRKAHHAVEEALKRGRLKKLPCEVCGTVERVHGHHSDYGKPLEVQWLCVTHHRQLHSQLKLATTPYP